MISLLYACLLNFILSFALPNKNGTVIIDIEGLKNESGKVNLSLYKTKEGFPSDPNKAFKIATSKIKKGKAHFEFLDVPPGQYAVAVLHDENDNNKMDLAFYGKPKEGFGFSNNAKKMFGPPDFEDAKFDFSGNEMKLVISMRYL